MDVKRLARRNLGRDDRYPYIHVQWYLKKNGPLQYDISFKVHC